MNVRITTVICTHNRAELLRGAMDSLCGVQPLRQFTWEIIVVLNNCSDASADVVEGFRERLPVRAVPEPMPGLSRARNRAVEVATGDFIIWIDDDVRVDCAWLRAYEEAFAAAPETSVFGGPIRAEFEGGMPAWLAPAIASVETAYAIKRVAAEGGPVLLQSNDFPFGANFAIRADVQRRHRYDPALGRKPVGPVIGGEEYELIHAVLKGGGTGLWVPGAKVAHIMPPERQTVDYLRRYFEGHGRLIGAMRSDRSTFQTLRDLRLTLRRTSRYLRLRATRPADRWVPALRDAAIAKGILLGGGMFSSALPPPPP